jgi:hypothetical protein
MLTRLVVPAVLAALIGAPAAATQHLIKPGEDWGRLSGRLRAGDEVILMPGRHRPGMLADAVGKAGKPIVIRGLDATRPAVIEGDRYGLRLIEPRHVELRDLTIQGGTISGVHASPAEKASARAGPLALERVTILEIGPKGLRHGLALDRIEGVRVQECTFEAWGGFAIEVVASRNVSIDGCRMRGRDGFGQMGGVRLRAGTDRATVMNCRFENAGPDAIVLGGGSKPEEFLPALSESAAESSASEVSSVQVEMNLFVGCGCAVAMSSVDRGTVRQNTIIDATRAVISLRHDHDDPRFIPLRSCSFGSNLVTWQPGRLERFQEAVEGTEPSQLFLEQNLWWCPGLDDTERARLMPFPGTGSTSQVTTVDPLLDADLKPRAREARPFGAAR